MYCTKLIWAQLVSGSWQLKWSDLKCTIPFLSSVPHFYTICNVCFLALALYPRQVPCTTLYLIWLNLWDKAHGRGEIIHWYSPSLTRHWNKIQLIFLLHELWNQFVLGLVVTASFPPLCMLNISFGRPELYSRTQLETNEFKSLAKCPSHDYLTVLQTGPRMEMTSRKTSAILIKMQHRHSVIAAAGTLSFFNVELVQFPFYFKWVGNGGILNCLQSLLFPEGKANRLATSEGTAVMKELSWLRQRFERDWLTHCCSPFPNPSYATEFYSNKTVQLLHSITQPRSHMLLCTQRSAM